MSAPSKFVVKPEGLYWGADEGEGGSPGTRVSSRLEVKALVRDAESGAWAKLVEWVDADGIVHEWAMPMAADLRDGNEALAYLANGGLAIYAKQPVLDYLRETSSVVRVRRVSKTGWHSENGKLCFVRPDCTVGDTGTVVKYVAAEGENAFEVQGQLQEWKEKVGALCVGNSRLLFAVSCAFASMVLKFTGDENGGFHLVGPSSCGKTTVARVAASVFGGERYVARWRTTDNGLEGTAEGKNDCLLVVDELGQADPRVVGSIAYMLANGQGKVRATRTGEARARKTWRLLFLSSGEGTLQQHMAEGGKKVKAGQEVRFVDLRADAGLKMGVFEELHGSLTAADFSLRLKDAAAGAFGAPSVAFAERCIPIADDIKGLVRSQQKTLVDEMLALVDGDVQPGGQVLRVAERFALVGAAGELATSLEITGWKAGAAEVAAKRCFLDWLSARSTAENSEPMTIIEQARDFLDRHLESRFSDLGDQEDPHPQDKSRATYNRAGWIRGADGRREYMILPEVFRREVCAGIDPLQACHILVEREAMLSAVEDGKTRFTLHRSVHGRKKRVYVLNDTLWDL